MAGIGKRWATGWVMGFRLGPRDAVGLDHSPWGRQRKQAWKSVAQIFDDGIHGWRFRLRSGVPTNMADL